jgi:hypothetical protein
VLSVGGFAIIIGYSYVAPMAALSRVDGICRIGIQHDASIAIIALDTAISLALTGIFVWQLRSTLGSVMVWPSSRTSKASSQQAGKSLLNVIRGKKNDHEQSVRATSQHNLRIMLIRNVVGSSLILCATIANNAIFTTREFASYSHACQLMCLTDSKYVDGCWKTSR